MSRLPPFLPRSGGGFPPAIPAIPATPSDHNRREYPVSGPRDAELTEIERRVQDEGYVLLWSTLLQDFVAFHRDDVDAATIPPGFVPYSESELAELSGDGDKPISSSGLKLIHKAKKQGGRITHRARDGDEGHI